jgi:hypothetical protein
LFINIGKVKYEIVKAFAKIENPVFPYFEYSTELHTGFNEFIEKGCAPEIIRRNSRRIHTPKKNPR